MSSGHVPPGGGMPSIQQTISRNGYCQYMLQSRVIDNKNNGRKNQEVQYVRSAMPMPGRGGTAGKQRFARRFPVKKRAGRTASAQSFRRCITGAWAGNGRRVRVRAATPGFLRAFRVTAETIRPQPCPGKESQTGPYHADGLTRRRTRQDSCAMTSLAQASISALAEAGSPSIFRPETIMSAPSSSRRSLMASTAPQ